MFENFHNKKLKQHCHGESCPSLHLRLILTPVFWAPFPPGPLYYGPYVFFLCKKQKHLTGLLIPPIYSLFLPHSQTSPKSYLGSASTPYPAPTPSSHPFGVPPAHSTPGTRLSAKSPVTPEPTHLEDTFQCSWLLVHSCSFFQPGLNPSPSLLKASLTSQQGQTSH